MIGDKNYKILVAEITDYLKFIILITKKQKI